jgi:hypothetical protein
MIALKTGSELDAMAAAGAVVAEACTPSPSRPTVPAS